MDLFPLFATGDEELIAYYLYKKKRYFFQLPKLQRPFLVERLSEEYCWTHFRFRKEHLLQLRILLGIPDVVRCSNLIKVNGSEALCIVLKRLAYPGRYADLMKFFPKTRCELSRIFNRTICLILQRHGNLIKNMDWLTNEDLSHYAAALRQKGCVYKNCIGFLDGTVRPICRPKINQREFYNGHKRTHALKFQSVMLPDGLIGHLHGPIPGRRHDAFLLESSQLIPQLRDIGARFGRPYHLYGDPAYPLLQQLLVPFKGVMLTPSQKSCNKIMSSIRESVEWGFAKIVQKFAFLDFKKNLKIGLQPVANYYLAGAILANCHTCLYGSQTSDYFNCFPPSLETYLK